MEPALSDSGSPATATSSSRALNWGWSRCIRSTISRAWSLARRGWTGRCQAVWRRDLWRASGLGAACHPLAPIPSRSVTTTAIDPATRCPSWGRTPASRHRDQLGGHSTDDSAITLIP